MLCTLRTLVMHILGTLFIYALQALSTTVHNLQDNSTQFKEQQYTIYKNSSTQFTRTVHNNLQEQH